MRPEAGGGVRLVGRPERVFTAEGLPDIPDAFQLEIALSSRVPKVAPRVFETAGRIPAKYHKLDDGSLCLSSPLRVTLALRTTPRLLPFFEDFVIAYLYRYAHIEKFKKDPWPDIKHSVADLIGDYARLLGASTHRMCLGYLELLGMKRRIANKKPCPCGSGVCVARCRQHHRRLNALRQRFKVVPRGWFRAEHAVLVRALEGQLRKRSTLDVEPAKPRSLLRFPHHAHGRSLSMTRPTGVGGGQNAGVA
ncbi:MAG: hypothetical protein H6837_16715 [Planctomycetes bacterium]|nr:hypothetical protein [Planctomycetota bacterium]